MKKILIFIVFVSFILPGLFAQVGINTQNISGVLHIDTKANNATTGTVTAASLKDDIIVDGNGNLGAGMSTTVPKAKVDVSSDSKWGALRITDGNEGEGMILFGDENGYARWGMLKGSGGYKLRITAPTTTLPLNTENRISLSNGFNYLPINAAGDYVVMIRVTYTFTATATLGWISVYHKLFKNSLTTPEESLETYVNVIGGQKFSAYALLRASGTQINDKIQIAINPRSYSLTIDTANSYIIFYRV